MFDSYSTKYITEPSTELLIFLLLFFVLLGKKLNLMNLLNFPGKKENIKIPQKIGTKYLEFGILLLNDETGAEVRTIVTKHHEAAD